MKNIIRKAAGTLNKDNDHMKMLNLESQTNSIDIASPSCDDFSEHNGAVKM
jgi:hypothetical protein